MPLSRRILLILGIVLGYVIALPSFLCVVNFAAAITPQEALGRGKPPMPAHWEAGVMNHGEYIQWYTIANHPLAFGGSVAALLAALVWIIYPRAKLKRAGTVLKSS